MQSTYLFYWQTNSVFTLAVYRYFWDWCLSTESISCMTCMRAPDSRPAITSSVRGAYILSMTWLPRTSMPGWWNSAEQLHAVAMLCVRAPQRETQLMHMHWTICPSLSRIHLYSIDRKLSESVSADNVTLCRQSTLLNGHSITCNVLHLEESTERRLWRDVTGVTSIINAAFLWIFAPIRRWSPNSTKTYSTCMPV